MARPNKRQPKVDSVLLRKLPPLPPPGALDTLDDVQREWQRIHRGRARGQMGDDEFRSLAYSLQVGGAVTRMAEELKVATAIVRQLEQLKTGGTVTYQPEADTDAGLLPAASEQTDDDKPLIDGGSL